MDPKFQSSFIPKQAITPESSKPRKRHGAGLVAVISSIVFVLSLLGAGGVIGYEFVLQNTINTKGIELESKRPFGDPERVAEFKDLHNKLRVAENLIDNHVAFSILFSHLEEITLQDVQFRNYAHKMDPNGLIQITLGGVARDYGTLVLQSEAFSQSDVISSAIFSDFLLDDRGNVNFKITASLKADVLRYRNTL